MLCEGRGGGGREGEVRENVSVSGRLRTAGCVAEQETRHHERTKKYGEILLEIMGVLSNY